MNEESPVKTNISHYRIVSKIGAGGMGEVYLAEDTRLDRKVALKLLPAEFTQDADRVRRFIQEAKAASALNHPNIITIYEIGEEQGTHFMATEFIDGQTLRQIMATRMPLGTLIEIAIQIASALGAAHAAGIVHRDIKPENVMVRPDGLVKVLDFGLAKLAERRTATVNEDAPTAFQAKTDPGTVMGTVTYMSPEQVEGLDIDGRTDIFSLGTVLYEMITGQLPFTGQTAGAIFGAILHRTPTPPSQLNHELPAELERIVTKALRKNREERYQTAKDLVVDLKSLKQELEIEAKLGYSLQSAPGREAASGKTHEQVKAETEQLSAVSTGTAHTTSSAEYVVSEIKRHKRAAVAVLLTLLVAIAAAIYFSLSSNRAIDSIAVLPFVNASADPNSEYLSDGLAESLINSLSQVPKLRVVPRGIVFSYKGREVDPRKVGSDLGVRAVLTGRVVQRGDTLSIQAELIDVASVAQLWGQQYNRKLSDILSVQEEIAQQISEKLRLRLSGQERQLTKRSTGSTEAYQAYLKGRYYWNKRTEDGLRKAIEYFKQATDSDPNYARAYAGLADSYALLTEYSATPAHEVMPKAKSAAQRALALDDRLSEAHTSLANVMSLYEWDFVGAEREFRRAIELDPNYATTHQWYSELLGDILGRFDEAIVEAKLAQQLDPLSLIINKNVALKFATARRYDQAVEQYKKTLEMDPNFGVARWELAFAYGGKGMYEEGIAEFQKVINHAGRRPEYLADFGQVYAASGRKDEAQKLRDELLERSKREHIPAVYFAIIYAGLGEKDQAFAWLEKAYAERSFYLAYLKTDRRFDNLRSDPRFLDLLRRMKLEGN